MNNELAKLIAAELLSWQNSLLIVALVIVCSGFGSWVARYLEKKAENYVTREDFVHLQEQLAASTRLVESVKSQVNHKDWAKREWTGRRFKKLEEIMQGILDGDDYVERINRHGPLSQDRPSSSPMFRLEALVRLYFPELTAVDEYASVIRDFLLHRLDEGSSVSRTPEYSEKTMALHRDLARRRGEAVLACAAMMREIEVEIGFTH